MVSEPTFMTTRAGQSADMGFIVHVGPLRDARHDTCVGTGRTVVCTKRERS